MRVGFACYIYDFHKNYCYNIAEEVEKRGGECFYPEKGIRIDVDFTIQPDHCYPRFPGSKGIYINHGLANWPQNAFFGAQKTRMDIHNNTDFIFLPSEHWDQWYKSLYEKPTLVAGFPLIDKLVNNLEPDGTVVYAPTHHYKADVYSGWDIQKMKQICLDMGFEKFVYRGHPVFNRNEVSLNDCFRRASVLVSDYSSVGLEAIALKIPTILIGNEKWNTNNPHISHQASVNAGQRIYNWTEFTAALERFKDPNYNMKNREHWSGKLCDYQGTSAKRIVDLMDGLL